MIDLRDRRGRLVRLVSAIAIGLAITIVLMGLIASDSVAPNGDPIGQGSVGLLAIAMFVAFTSLAHAIILRVRRRARRA